LECQGSAALRYWVSFSTTDTYQWVYDGTGATITSGQGTSAITVTYAANAISGTWTVTPFRGACAGVPGTIAVTLGNQRIVRVKSGATGAGDGSSWTNAYARLQDALVNAQACDEIWVAAGSHRPDLGGGSTAGDRNASFHLASRVSLYGGFAGSETTRSQRSWSANQTILTGDLAGNDGANFTNNSDNSCHIIDGGAVDATAVLDGFVIKSGNANTSCAAQDGGGMVTNGGGPNLLNCTFTGNYARGYGGGLHLQGARDTVISDCTFASNQSSTHGGGMHVFQASGIRVLGTLFYQNTTGNAGGGLRNSGGGLTLVGCTFDGNSAGSGGGMYDNGGANLLRVLFRKNTATVEGGGMNNGDTTAATLVDCIFAGNSAGTRGGAFSNSNGINGTGGSPRLINCTFAGNSAPAGGGGAVFAYNSTGRGSPVFTNCVLWDNVSPQVVDSGDPSNVSYSCIQGGWSGPGSNSVSLDPLFVNAKGPDGIYGTADDDLRLQPTSPAIDAANNLAIPADKFDLDGDGNVFEPVPFDFAGNPRFRDMATVSDTGSGTPPIVDMGAYEAY
jgi:hypothetical protein